ncbi:hypothetical protein [Dyadobacter sp. LHD-138]|uniref:lipopolysaccharide biosynthesis protein n=1 Tax=Dyadobacter sp. LHD-138 TaxID=3071413 RepID=UPI0027E06411|nr:hypothetical protein [Dyadobacter sp. LHD-138]MDQ6481557.1 hypothetical protein [Dyadobacter sp. LHD-138]
MNQVSKFKYLTKSVHFPGLSANAVYTASVLGRQGLGFLINLLLAKFTLPDVYADYASYLNIGTYLLLAGNFGFSEYSLIQSVRRSIQIENYISFFLGVATLVLGIIITGGHLLGYSLLFMLVVGKIFFDTVLNEILLPWYQKYNLFGRLAKINFVYSACFVFLIGVLWVEHISIEAFLFGAILISLILTVIQIIPIVGKIFTGSEFKIPPPIDKDLIYYGLNYVTVPIYMRLVPLLVVLMLDNKSIAEFHLGFTIASACLVVALSQIKVILPKLISSQDIKPILISNIKILTIFNIAILCAFILIGNFVINLLYPGENFSRLYMITIGMILANILQTISGVLACVLSAKNFQRKKLMIQIEIIFFSFLVGWVLIHYWGSMGGVLTIFLTYSYVIVRNFLMLHKLGLLTNTK